MIIFILNWIYAFLMLTQLIIKFLKIVDNFVIVAQFYELTKTAFFLPSENLCRAKDIRVFLYHLGNMISYVRISSSICIYLIIHIFYTFFWIFKVIKNAWLSVFYQICTLTKHWLDVQISNHTSSLNYNRNLHNIVNTLVSI